MLKQKQEKKLKKRPVNKGQNPLSEAEVGVLDREKANEKGQNQEINILGKALMIVIGKVKGRRMKMKRPRKS